MTRTEAEEALLDLINASTVRQKIAADCDFLDATKLSDTDQLIEPPFILMRPLRFEYVPQNKRPSDLYGITYDDTEYFIGFMLGARNYHGMRERLHGDGGEVGVNELLAGLEELLRGVNLSTGDRTPGVPRVFLVNSEFEEDTDSITVYSLTVRIVGLVLE